MSVFSVKNLSSEPPEKEAKRHAIMLIDDEEANLKAMARLLEKSFEVFTAISADQALLLLAQYQNTDFSMIISDQRMPGMTGVQFFEEIIDSYPDTLRLIVSGQSDMRDIIAAINKAHIYQYIPKPIDPADFLIKVKLNLKNYDKIKASHSKELKLGTDLKICKDAHQLNERQLSKAYKKLKELGVDPATL